MSDTDATQVRQDVVADVDEILEHIINGNMLSMPYDVYVELFDAVDGLGVALEKMQAENAKLRELVKDMVLNIGGCALHGNPLRLREFMARARELGVEVNDG